MVVLAAVVAVAAAVAVAVSSSSSGSRASGSSGAAVDRVSSARSAVRVAGLHLALWARG